MFRRLLRRRPAPGTIMGGLALFISLGGIGYAATGGSFILGQSNTAANTSSLSSGVTTGPSLNVTNTGGRSAARFTTNAGITPFSVSNSTKIGSLNADLLDGVDSTAFLQSSCIGCVKSSQVLDNSLGGNDINETHLNLGDHFAANYASRGCTGDFGGLETCTSFGLSLAHAGRVLLNASGSWFTVQLDDDSGVGSTTDDPTLVRGRCGLYVDGVEIGGATRYMGERQQSGVASNHPLLGPGTVALTALSRNLSAGDHSFNVSCTELDGNLNWIAMSLAAAVVDDASAP
jgi:hypothetical protein